MANEYKCVNSEMIELTDTEQSELESRRSTYDKTKENSFVKRNERNVLLAETDWMANSDVTMSDAWKTYRQALRDLPTQSGFPDVEFPTKPE